MRSWASQMVECLADCGISVVVHVPDEVLTPLIKGAEQHSDMRAFAASREEEAIGIAAGVVLGGSRAVVLMQSSGFGNSVNALASLIVPYQLPIVMIIGERGVLGEFNQVQVAMSRVVRPALDRLGIPHRTLEDAATLTRTTSLVLEQAYETNQPAALIINPLLTGGKKSR